MSHLTTQNGIDWNYEIVGEGEPLLFLHGWGVDRRIFRQQIKHFCHKYQVLSIDLPGHGQTSWTDMTLGEMARDVGKIIHNLGIQEMSIVGSSVGGLLGLKLFEFCPLKVKRMIFVGSMPKFSKSNDYPYGLDIERMRKLEGQLDNAYPEIVNIFFRSLFTRQERLTRRYKWMHRFRRDIEVPKQKALVKYLDILEHEDLRNVLKQVNVPMIFMNGSADPICCQNAILALKEMCPEAKFVFFEECGHFPFLSKAYEFNGALEMFLKETR